MFSRGARQSEPGAWIDDLPRMHGGAHRRVPTRAGDVEQTEPFHEEGPLLAEERREALIDLDLELVAFHLAEIGVVRSVERDRRRQPVLHAHAEISTGPCI